MLGSACVYCELTQLIDLCGITAWGLHLDGIFQCFVKCWGLLVMCHCELTQLTWTRLICVVASGIEAWSLCRDGLSMPMQAARFIIRPRTQEAFTFIRMVRSLGLVFLSVKKPNKIVDWINSFTAGFLAHEHICWFCHFGHLCQFIHHGPASWPRVSSGDGAVHCDSQCQPSRPKCSFRRWRSREMAGWQAPTDFFVRFLWFLGLQQIQ